MGVPPAEQQRIIDRLQDEGFINEERYCRAFVNDKLRFNRWGRVKIRAALYEKQLPREYIAQAIEEIDEEEYMQTLHDLVATKQRELKNEDFATKQRLYALQHRAALSLQKFCK